MLLPKENDRENDRVLTRDIEPHEVTTNQLQDTTSLLGTDNLVKGLHTCLPRCSSTNNCPEYDREPLRVATVPSEPIEPSEVSMPDPSKFVLVTTIPCTGKEQNYRFVLNGHLYLGHEKQFRLATGEEIMPDERDKIPAPDAGDHELYKETDSRLSKIQASHLTVLPQASPVKDSKACNLFDHYFFHKKDIIPQTRPWSTCKNYSDRRFSHGAEVSLRNCHSNAIHGDSLFFIDINKSKIIEQNLRTKEYVNEWDIQKLLSSGMYHFWATPNRLVLYGEKLVIYSRSDSKQCPLFDGYVEGVHRIAVLNHHVVLLSKDKIRLMELESCKVTNIKYKKESDHRWCDVATDGKYVVVLKDDSQIDVYTIE